MGSEKENHVVNGEDEAEEEQMEQFFALLRNFRAARNRRKRVLIQIEQEGISEKTTTKKNKISKRGDDGEQSSWVPSFVWEDFTAEIEFRRPPIIFPPSYNSKQEEKKQEDDGLDLNLTLSPASS